MMRPASPLPKPCRSARLLSVSIGEVRPSSCVIGPRRAPMPYAPAVAREDRPSTCRSDRSVFIQPSSRSSQLARRSGTSFENELLAAYDIAFKAGRDHAHRPQLVWAFPAGKPQVFAHTPRALSKGVMMYGFGRRLPRWTQSALALQVRVPILRRLLAEPTPNPPPVCGWTTLACSSRRSVSAQRSVLVGVDPFPVSVGQAAVQHARARPHGHAALVRGGRAEGEQTTSTVVCPRRARFALRRVSIRSSYETLVGAAIRTAATLPPAREMERRTGYGEWLRTCHSRSKDVLPRADGIPPHWRPIHGDYVPWNLREDDRGQLWLLDWEDAGGGLHSPTSSATSSPTIRLAGAVLTDRRHCQKDSRGRIA